MVEVYPHSPIHLHDVVLNKLSTGTALPYGALSGCAYPVQRTSLKCITFDFVANFPTESSWFVCTPV
jgi:hypothetical protein